MAKKLLEFATIYSISFSKFCGSISIDFKQNTALRNTKSTILKLADSTDFSQCTRSCATRNGSERSGCKIVPLQLCPSLVNRSYDVMANHITRSI